MPGFSQSADWLHAFGSLFFPHLCAGCGNNTLARDEAICHRCIAHLPATGFAKQTGNPIEKLFWGRIPVAAACSQFYFTRSSTMQQILHALKYKGNKEAGIVSGRLLGYSLLESGRFDNIDAILPLPLYPEKERKRGYNQATVIAKGIQDIIKIPIISNAVARDRFTSTQTKKNRVERWANVSGVFSLQNPEALCNKNILLTDDVVTTGSSLEACGQIICEAGIRNLFIATLAFADQ